MRSAVGGATPRRYASAERIAGMLQSGQDVHMLIDGMARAVNHSRSGDEVTCAILTPGDLIGEVTGLNGNADMTAYLAVDECLTGQSHAPFSSA